MTLPTGAISFSDINTELVRNSNQSLSLNDSDVRLVAEVPSGQISMGTLRGKSYYRMTNSNTAVQGLGQRIGAGTVTATSTQAFVTVVGGVAPVTYTWEYVSGDVLTIVSPSTASTAFRKSLYVNGGAFETLIGVYRCKVTDGANRVLYGPNVTVELTLMETSV